MQTNYLAMFCLLTIFSTVASAVATAKEVTVQHRGLTLNAEFELAEGKTLADGVILITHGALAHYDMESIVYLRDQLRERGHNTLAINLSLGLDNRRGMYDCNILQRHKNNDAVEEIGVWLDWLEKQGATNVSLLGHSRGGAQAALYAAERHPPLLNTIILMAPATADNTSADAYLKRYGKPLSPLLEQARHLVENGKSEGVLENAGFLTCLETDITAEAFLSYYSNQALVDSPSLIPKVQLPTLVVVAGSDDIVVGLDKKIEPLAEGRAVQMVIIEGADHMFRDLYMDDAVEAIAAFLTAYQSSQNSSLSEPAGATQPNSGAYQSVSGDCPITLKEVGV